MYFLVSFFVISSMFLGISEPVSGTLVIPGMSIRVRFVQDDENIVSLIGLSTIFLFLPAFSSVICSILLFTSVSKFL